MIRNRRYAVGDELWELPAGTLGCADPTCPTEDPAACAARELIEETGYRAGRLTRLNAFFSAPGFCNELLTAFLAEQLEFVGQSADEGESITAHAIDWHQALAWAQTGEIRDAKTLATLLWAQCFLAPHWPPTGPK
jgi:ADP-ribose pyrophosphatase